MPLDQALPKPLKPSALARPELTFQWEGFESVFSDAAPLLRRHWEETEPLPDVGPFDPDFDAYFELERRGFLAIYTARRQGALVGLNSFFVAPSITRRTIIAATSDMFIVAHSERGTWTAYKLIRGIEDGMLKRGVRLMLWSPASKYVLDPLLLRAGYVKTGGRFSKDLKAIHVGRRHS